MEYLGSLGVRGGEEISVVFMLSIYGLWLL